MKAFVIISVMAALGACSSSSPKTADNKSAAQANLDAAHAISSAFEKGDRTAIDSLIADDFVDHREYGDVRGRDSLKVLVGLVNEHVHNLKIKTIKELADEDYVMSWKTFTGNGDGQANTTPGDFDVSGVQITRFKNGKATEHWEALDIQDVYRLIKKISPADTTQ